MRSCSPVATYTRPKTSGSLGELQMPKLLAEMMSQRSSRLSVGGLTSSGRPASATAASSCARSSEWMPPRARATCQGAHSLEARLQCLPACPFDWLHWSVTPCWPCMVATKRHAIKALCI